MSDRVLIVEDSATQAAALSALLEEHGYQVDHAPSAEAALERVAVSEYDLVLTDVVMPGLSGYELCHRLKNGATERSMPVVLLTSLTDPLDIVRGLECGADNYVTKPYEAEHLLARVRNAVDRRKLRRHVRASMGVNVSFLGTTFSITADKEQILDLFISSVEDVVRTNQLLRVSQQELSQAQQQLESYATRMAYQARVSSEKYATLMAHAHDAIFVLDDDGAIMEANVQALDLLGRTLDQVRGRAFADVVRQDQRATLRDRLARLRSEALASEDEIWFEHVSGRSTCCSLAASRSVVGERGLVLIILHDVTQRRRDQEELASSAERLRLALDGAQMGTWEWDVARRELRWSSGSSLGLGPDAGADEHWSLDAFVELIHADDRERVMAALMAMTHRDAPQEVEFRLESTQRERRWVYVKGRGVSDPNEGGRPTRVVGVLLDVTKQRAIEAQLQQAQKMEAVGQLASGVAHDFNNMLTAILSYAQLALEELRDDVARADVQEIVGAAQRAAGLTRQLLAFSRQQVLQPRALDINATVENIEKMLRRLIPESIHLETRLAPDLWTVHADPGQLEQVLMNLAVNARDAMGETGTLSVETANVVVAHGPSGAQDVHGEVPPGEYITLSVADTGSGIDPKVREHIFEPFFTTKPAGQGTGLGLATIYGIVKQSGGHIELQTEMGVGSTFTIYLPRADLPVDPFQDPPVDSSTARGSELILIAEDDADLRAVTLRVLRQAGYRVIETSDGRQALLHVERQRDAIQLVVADVVMPHMTGHELARLIRERGVTAPMVLMSGYAAGAASTSGAMEPGVTYLEKPFTPEILTRRVREALDTAVREKWRTA